MTTQKTYISQLTPELNPRTIKVKVLRAWCYRKAKMAATHRHFEMIVVDEKVFRFLFVIFFPFKIRILINFSIISL